MLLSEKSRRSLQTLKLQHSEWCEQVSKFISSFGEAMPVPLDYDSTASVTTTSAASAKTISRTEHAIEEQFRALLTDMDALLHPLLGKGSAVEEFINKVNCSTNKSDVSSSAVLLLDPYLLDLPFEALHLFQDVFAGKVTRDFSVHMFRSRLVGLERGAKTGGAKGALATPVVSATRVRSVVDPFNDASKNPLGSISKHPGATPTPTPRAPDTLPDIQPGVLASYDAISSSVASGGKWNEIVPRIRRGAGVALQDWLACSCRVSSEDAAQDGALFVYAPGKVLGNLMASKDASALDFRNTALAFISSLGQTDSSYRRQLSVDSRKHASEVQKETPLRLATLLSLAGTGSLVVTQWSTSFASQHRYASLFWEALATRHCDVVTAVAEANQLCTSSPKDIGSKSASVDVTDNTTAPKWRQWVKYARVVFGCGNVSYSES